MIRFKKKWVFLSIVVFFVLKSTGFAKFDDSNFTFFNWENPAPRFSNFDFDIQYIENLIGQSQFLIYHTEKDFNLWTNDSHGGRVRKYKNQRFVSSFVIINKEREDVIAQYMDFEQYPKMMAQCSAAGVVKSSGNQYLVKILQEYKTLVLNLTADFRFLYDVGQDGNISALLLDGDVKAGVARIEFFTVDDTRTLVVSTTWLDLSSARHIYRLLINALPEIKLTAPLGTAAMVAKQYRQYLEGEEMDAPPSPSENLPVCPNIPVYGAEEVPVATWRKLSKMGTLVFVQPAQWINTDQGARRVEFISAMTLVPANISTVQPLSSDFSRFPEYFHRAKNVEVRNINGQHEILWQFKFGLKFIGFEFEYVTLSEWQNSHTVFYLGTKGDIQPLHGAFEWIDLKNDTTLIVFSVANHIGDDAPWTLRLARKIPQIDVLTSMFMSVLAVEKQGDWIMDQLK